jgi:hypothetical protein
MHEKGSFNTKNNIIFNKINNKIKIREVSLIISESQNLILKIGDANSPEIFTYCNEYIKSLTKTGHDALAQDIKLITIKPNKIITMDHICTLLNYVTSNYNVKLTDWLKQPELKLISKIQKLQLYGW